MPFTPRGKQGTQQGLVRVNPLALVSRLRSMRLQPDKSGTSSSTQALTQTTAYRSRFERKEMEGTVQARGSSKAGKPTITIDGQLYYAGNTDLAGIKAGDRLSFEATAFGTKGNLWGINKGWKVIGSTEKYSPPFHPQGQPVPHTAAPAPANAAPAPQERPSGITEAERLTISNWVAAAIQAGIIKDPVDMGIWAASACQSIRFAGTTWPKNSLGDRLSHFLEHGTDPDEKIPF